VVASQPERELALNHYAQRRLLAETAAVVAARQWAAVEPAAIAGSWQRQLPATAVALTGGQAAAARAADPYVQAALLAQGVAASSELSVVPEAFTGPADGRDLWSLLMQPVVTALQWLRSGRPAVQALAAGGLQLDTIVRTEVADAGRLADQVSATTHGAERYVWVQVPPSCSRCIILAGRVYEWSTGFKRHPGCNCEMWPLADAEATGMVRSPEDVYGAMSPAERSKAGWSKADQRAIAAGADIGQVTNIHRGGLYVAGGQQFTFEGATSRSLAGQRLGLGRGRRVMRKTPAQILRDAQGDRSAAVLELWRHGYIVSARPLIPVGGAVDVLV